MSSAPAIVGLLVLFVSVAKIVFHLSQEFPDDDPQVRTPLEWAVTASVDFRRFKSDEWRAFRALYYAVQFSQFHERYKPLLQPALGFVVFVFITVMCGILFFYLRRDAPEPSLEWVVVTGYGLVCGSWMLLIERAKTLKRQAARWRVT